jgi:non-homologous end joining protein Ku
VKFVSGDREKYAVIGADGECLTMSILIHHNYQRQAPGATLTPLPNPKEYAEKLVKAISKKFDPSSTVDRYEECVQKYIEELKRSAASGGKPKGKFTFKPAAAKQSDFLSMLDDL